EFMWYQFIEGIAHINLGYFLEATVLLTIPIGAYLLYRLKSTGWGLLYSYSLFTSTGLFISAALNWNRESTGIEILDLMLNETSSLEYILGGFFYVALALTLLSKPIRNVFLISTTKLLIWTGIGFVLLPLLVYFT
ncbi:MAG: hypothetical protein ACPGWM_09765, partial [Flavobacteriales bacterium]